MITKCILLELETKNDYIILKTTKGDFKIEIKKGVSTISIINNNKEYLGLISLKKDLTLTIHHNNNKCDKIIINQVKNKLKKRMLNGKFLRK